MHHGHHLVGRLLIDLLAERTSLEHTAGLGDVH